MAVNQAVKAIAIARSYISVDQMDLVCVPAFVKLELESEERTAMKFICRSHKLEGAADAAGSIAQNPAATSEP
jgi:stage V sporulation protein S